MRAAGKNGAKEGYIQYKDNGADGDCATEKDMKLRIQIMWRWQGITED